VALTEEQKLDVRMYLGWSERFHQFDSELEQAIAALETLPAAETRIVELVAECQRIDASITAAEARLKALKVGSIELTGGGEIEMLRGRGRQAVGRMASLLGVEVRHDAFAAHAPRARATRTGMVGGGNRQLHG